MSRIERLTERAITLAIAEVDEELAVARLTFLAQDDHAALDAAIDACLARTERTLYTRWQAIGFLVRVRYKDQPTPDQPTASCADPSNGNKSRAPGNSRGPRRDASQARTAPGRRSRRPARPAAGDRSCARRCRAGWSVRPWPWPT
jgi:hypothetical protein